MQDIDLIAEKIFKLVKTERNLYYENVYKMEGISNRDAALAWSKLRDNYRLILDTGGYLSLSEEGEKHKDVESYLNSIRKNKIDWYRIAPITLTLIFGLSTFYFANKNYNQKENHFVAVQELDSVKNQLASCASQLVVQDNEIATLTKQIEQSKIQPSKPTSQTKN